MFRNGARTGDLAQDGNELRSATATVLQLSDSRFLETEKSYPATQLKQDILH